MYKFNKYTKWICTFFMISIFNICCASAKYTKTVDYVDMPRFMTKWYVIAGRTTSLEEGAHNSVEHYKWNEKKSRIDIDFTFRKDSFEGELKSIPQKAWLHNKKTNAHWKVQPFWPLKMDYLVIALEPEYKWTAIGVPDEKYLWIMATSPYMNDEDLNAIINYIDSLGYSTENVTRVPQKW